MGRLKKVLRILQIVQARYCLQFNPHIVTMVITFVLASFYSAITVLLPKSQVSVTLRWFDIFGYLNPQVINILFLLLCLMVLSMFLWQIYSALKWNNMEFNIIQKYLIKIVGNIGFVLTHALMFPLLNAFIEIIYRPKQEYDEVTNDIAWLTMILFSIIVLPLHTFLIVDLAPLSRNTHSNLFYLSSIRVMVLIRMIVTIDFLFSSVSSYGILLPCLAILMITQIFHPVEHYKYDKVIRVINYCGIWPYISRSIATMSGIPASLPFYYICLPFFVSFLTLISENLAKRILAKPDIQRQKLKILLSSIKQGNYSEITNFYLIHRQKCTNVQCSCLQIKIIQGNLKHNQYLWNQLIWKVIQVQFPLKNFSSLNESQRIRKLPKQSEIYLIGSNILSIQLKKWNQALHFLQFFEEQLNRYSFIAFSFRAFIYKFKEQMQQFNNRTIVHPNTINKSAQTYYEFQKNVIKLQKYIKKSAQTELSLWNQIMKPEPNIQSLKTFIAESYQYRRSVQSFITFIEDNFDESKEIISPLYTKYYLEVWNDTDTVVTKLSTLIKCEQHNIKYFRLNSQTPLFVLSLNNNQSFGKVVLANRQFLTLIVRDDSLKDLYTDQLILKCQQNEQNYKLRKFVEDNSFIITETIFINVGESCFRKLHCQIHIIPSVLRGIEAAFFITEEIKQNLFVCDQNGKIEYQNKYFKKNLRQRQLPGQNNFMVLFNQKILLKVIRNKTFQLKSMLKTTLREKDKFASSMFEISMQKEFQKVPKQIQHYLIKVQINQANQTIREDYRFKSLVELEQCPRPKTLILQSDLSKFQIKKIQLQQMNSKVKFKKIVKQISLLEEGWIIKVWKISTLIMLLGIFCMICLVLDATLHKKEELLSQISILDTKNQIKNNLIESLYYLRKANIEALYGRNQQKFDHYVYKFNSFNQAIIPLIKKIGMNYGTPLMGCFLDKKDLKYQTMSLYQVFNLKILSSTTYLSTASMNNFSLPLIKSQWGLQLTDYEIKLYQVLKNGLFFVIPYFRQFFANEVCSQNCSKTTILELYNFLGLSLISIIMVVSSFLYYKVLVIKYASIGLISQILPSEVKRKYKRIERFLRNQFALNVNLVSERNKKYTIDQNQKKLWTGDRNSLKHKDSHPSEQTSKQLKIQSQSSVVEAIIQREFENMKPKTLNFCKYIFLEAFKTMSLIMAPILISMIILASYNLSQLKILSDFSSYKLMEMRKTTLKQIKLYTLELGLHQGPFLDESLAVQTLVINRFSFMLQLQRKFKILIDQSGFPPNIKEKWDKFNEQNVCELLNLLEIQPTLEIKFTKQECIGIGTRQDFTKGMSTSVDGYISDSKLIWQKYRNCTNCDINTRVKFIHEVNLKNISVFTELGMMEQYFSVIIDYQKSLLRQNFIQQIAQYFKLTLIIGLIGIVSFLITIYVLLVFLSRQMGKNFVEIKSVFELISVKTIQEDQELRNVINKAHYEYFEA